MNFEASAVLYLVIDSIHWAVAVTAVQDGYEAYGILADSDSIW